MRLIWSSDCVCVKNRERQVQFFSRIIFLVFGRHAKVAKYFSQKQPLIGYWVFLMHDKGKTTDKREISHDEWIIQYWSLLNWQNCRFCCGSIAVQVNWNFVVISPYFVIFKNVEHSLEPSEMLSHSASHHAPIHNVLNPFSTETVVLVGYWSPITDTLLYT